LKRWKIWFGLLLLLALGAVLAVPTSRFAIVGWLRNDSWYEGRPTSYWRYELGAWHFVDYGIFGAKGYPGSRMVFLEREPSWWEELLRKVPDSDHYISPKSQEKLALLNGDAAALPVLTELLKDRDTTIRIIAVMGLYEIGKDAKPAAGALVEIAGEKLSPADEANPDSEKHRLRRQAFGALSRIDPELHNKVRQPGNPD
jgi:hypothetical protein